MNNQLEKWVLKPGQRYSASEKMEKVIKKYLKGKSKKKIMCLNDNDELLYFIEQSEDGSTMSSDVALFYNDDYIFLPKDLSDRLAKAYILNNAVISEAYDYLEDQIGESNGD